LAKPVMLRTTAMGFAKGFNPSCDLCRGIILHGIQPDFLSRINVICPLGAA
jgi:hypothetical protein